MGTSTLTLTSSLSTASSSLSWTGKESSQSLLSLEQRRSPWTTRDFVEGSPTGSFSRLLMRTLNRHLGPEIPGSDLGPPSVSVLSARSARPPSSSGGGGIREETKFCIFSSDATFHSCCFPRKRDQHRKINP